MIKVTTTLSKSFSLLNDDTFFFFCNDKGIEKVKEIKLYSSTFEIYTRYEEFTTDEKIESFNFDQIKNIFMILSSFTTQDQGISKTIYKFKLFSLEKEQTVYDATIDFPPLIGRLKSGLYTFADGHMYYNNNVIKIRYDLIFSEKNQNLKQNEIFDYYFDIFDLQPGRKVRSNTPLDSIRSHKFAYIISDKNFDKPYKLLVYPYLHDRKIYLNRIKLNTDYFYTSIETSLKDEEMYHQ